MSAFLASTFGKAAVFWVDILCGLAGKALYYFSEDDDD